MKFNRLYNIVIPSKQTYTLHDAGCCSYRGWDNYRKQFCKLYPEFKFENIDLPDYAALDEAKKNILNAIIENRIKMLFQSSNNSRHCILFSEHKVFSKVQPPYQEAIVIDGLLMATQYDIPWREDLFKGWHLYDCSQSIEFQKSGYKVVVPAMDTSWCIHENDIVNLKDYAKWRAVFENEYKNYYFQ